MSEPKPVLKPVEQAIVAAVEERDTLLDEAKGATDKALGFVLDPKKLANALNALRDPGKPGANREALRRQIQALLIASLKAQATAKLMKRAQEHGRSFAEKMLKS